MSKAIAKELTAVEAARDAGIRLDVLYPMLRAGRLAARKVDGRWLIDAAVHGRHEAPQATCTCGIYAAKSFDHLRDQGYLRRGIRGEVYLWGNVIEHQSGYDPREQCEG